MPGKKTESKRRNSDGVRAYFGEDVRGPYVSLSEESEVIVMERGEPRDDVIALFDHALLRAKRKKDDVREIAVDRGPGGFSAVRIRVAAASSLAVSLSASLSGVDSDSPDEVAVMQKKLFSATKVITPIYISEPNITTPRHGKGVMVVENKKKK